MVFIFPLETIRIYRKLRYASLNTHKGLELSRRDDFESLSYVLIYLAKGVLPWMNLKAKNQSVLLDTIFKKKSNTLPKEIAKGLPDIFRICDLFKETSN